MMVGTGHVNARKTGGILFGPPPGYFHIVEFATHYAEAVSFGFIEEEDGNLEKQIVQNVEFRKKRVVLCLIEENP